MSDNIDNMDATGIDPSKMGSDDLLRLLIEQQSFFHEAIVHELHRQYELQFAVALLRFKDDEAARSKLTELVKDNGHLDYKTPLSWQAMMQRANDSE